MVYVLKRNGAIVEFDKQKIINAINKAVHDVYPDYVQAQCEYFLEHPVKLRQLSPAHHSAEGP